MLFNWRLLIPFLLLLIGSGYGHAQIQVNKEQQQAYEKVFLLQFDEAEKLLQGLDSTDCNIAVNYHIKDFIDFLKTFISEKDYNERLSRRNERIRFWKNLPDNSPYKNYFIGDSYLRWALISVKFNNEFQGAIEFRKAYLWLKENDEKFPEFWPSNADFEIARVLLGTIPNQYKWIINLINMKGVENPDEGIENIDISFQQIMNSEQFSHLQTPILFMHAFMQLNVNFFDYNQILQLLDKYLNRHQVSNQPLFVFLYANILQKQHNSAEALEILSAYQPDSNTTYPFYFLNYMKGKAFMHQLDGRCVDEFKTYIHHFKGKNHIKGAYQKWAWYELINGDTLSYQKLMQQIKTVGENIVQDDKNALKEAESGKIPNIVLLKSRLLSDGGFFKKSIRLLQKDFKAHGNITSKAEYHYRLGRNYHLLKSYTLAIQQYDFTYKYGKSLSNYFAANALLMKGRILKMQHKNKYAIKTFEKCLELSNFEYEWTIHRKCKVELERLKENY